MKLSKTMERAIQEKDLEGIYASFYTLLLYDPSFSTGDFDEALRYVRSLGIPGFIQGYNGTEFKNENEWSEAYWDLVASELVDNFCLERISHLKKISAKIYPKKTVSTSNCTGAPGNRPESRKPEMRGTVGGTRSDYGERVRGAKEKGNNQAAEKGRKLFHAIKDRINGGKHGK